MLHVAPGFSMKLANLREAKKRHFEGVQEDSLPEVTQVSLTSAIQFVW